MLSLWSSSRQLRVLWFTCRREYSRHKFPWCSHEISEDERKKRAEYPGCPEYWDKKLNQEEKASAFLAAISTLSEDAPEITLQLYFILAYGITEDIIGQLKLRYCYSSESLSSIVYYSYTIKCLFRFYRFSIVVIGLSVQTKDSIVCRNIIIPNYSARNLIFTTPGRVEG